MPRGSEDRKSERLPGFVSRRSSGRASALPGDVSGTVYGLAQRRDWDERFERPALKNEKDHSQN